MDKNHTASVLIDLSAAIVSVRGDQPVCLTVPEVSGYQTPGLPFGPFYPDRHRTMEIGLRQWVIEQTALDIGYVEQLYTFGDRGRRSEGADNKKENEHIVSVGYLALSKQCPQPDQWSEWYKHFPWEDWREGRPNILNQQIIPYLEAWAGSDELRRLRLQQAFGVPDKAWNDEFVLDRYELMYEAGLVWEAYADGRQKEKISAQNGIAMQLDHRRILATAMSRLRAKLKYRPVVFELMPSAFTLTHVQKTTEAILGAVLHKQNFRRQLAKNELVEPTGKMSKARGRPAELFKFKHDESQSTNLPGLRIPLGKSRNF
ncbi:MAG: NUDIX hydrolase [Candidatus Micropelagos thuwalensis]